MTMSGHSAESAQNFLKQTAALAKSAGVAPAGVMEDIAGSSEAVAAYTKDGGENIAQAAVKAYKKAGGEYISYDKSATSLHKWTEQKWRTKSGKKSSVTGERYLPSMAIESLSNEEYKLTSNKKKKDSLVGKQFSKQPISIARKIKKFRT